MSFTIIQKKLDELKEKEKKIQDFYDPVKIHRFQHPHIQDLRDDHREDIQNYGFSRFALKEDLSDISVDRVQQQQTNKITAAPAIQSPQGTLGSFSKKQQGSTNGRPTTAVNRLSQQSFNPASTIVSTVSEQEKTINGGGMTSTLNKASSTIQSGFMQTINGRPQTAMQKTLGSTIQSINTRTIQSAGFKNQMPQQDQWGFDSLNDRVPIGSSQLAANNNNNNYNNFMRNGSDYNRNSNTFNEVDGVYEDDGEGDNNFDPTRENADNNRSGSSSPRLDSAGKIAKHWKFTKKYDTNGRSAIRNQSALKKIVMNYDGAGGASDGGSEIDEETTKQRSEKQMESRFNQKKIFINATGEVCLDNKPPAGVSTSTPAALSSVRPQSSQSQSNRKFSPSYRDKDAFIDSFFQQKLFLDEDAAQLKKIYAFTSPSKTTGGTLIHKEVVSQLSPVQSSSSVRFIQSAKNHSSSSNIQMKRPQTAVASKKNNSNHNARPPSALAPIHQHHQSQNHHHHLHNSSQQSHQSSTTTSGSINLVTKDELKLNQMRRIKSAVLDKNGPNRFFGSTKDLTPIELTDWFFPNMHKDFSFKVQVTDMKTMCFVKYDNVKVVDDELIHTTYKDEKQPVDFMSILELMSRQHQPSHAAISPLHFFHVLIYQKLQSDEDTILYEKFIFKGSATRFLELNVINILLTYYIRHLLCFDPSDISFSSIYDNSLYILEKKKSIPLPFYEFFLKLSQKAIYVEDVNQRTFQHYVFPQLQLQLSTHEIQQLPASTQHYPSLNKYLENKSTLNTLAPLSKTTSDRNKNGQIKRPTTAQPLSQNAIARFAAPTNVQTFDNEDVYEQEEYPSAGHTHQLSLSGSPPALQQQRKVSNPMNSASRQSLAIMQKDQLLSPSSGFLHRQAYPLDYSKNTSQHKHGLRPKTAVAKQTRSPSVGMLMQSTSSTTLQGLMMANSPGSGTHPNSAQNKKFEKHVKSMTQFMCVKGNKVSPSFNNGALVSLMN